MQENKIKVYTKGQLGAFFILMPLIQPYGLNMYNTTNSRIIQPCSTFTPQIYIEREHIVMIDVCWLKSSHFRLICVHFTHFHLD